MKKINIQIADKQYKVELAQTDEEHDNGLQGRNELAESEETELKVLMDYLPKQMDETEIKNEKYSANEK